MLAYPQVDQSYHRLSGDGWSMADLCIDHPQGRSWVVTGHRGKHWIVARAPSQAAAWFLAWEQAERLKPKPRRRKAG